MASSKLEKSSYNIVLVGKTGHGKSSTGNTILNRTEFKTFIQATSGTLTCQMESAKLENVTLNIIDTPGIMDTCKTPEEIWGELVQIMSLCPDGFHGFVFVFQSTSRFTKEEIETVHKIKSFFGPDFIKCCLIGFTHGDGFDLADDAIPFSEWLKQQTGEMATLIRDCDNRCLLFYNTTNYPLYQDKRKETVSKLVQLIQERKMLYTDGHFNEAVKSRQKLILEEKLPQLSADYQRQLSLLLAELNEANEKIKTQSLCEISVVEKKIKALRATIEKDDQGTDVLKEFKDSVDILTKSLNDLKPENKACTMRKMVEYIRLLKNPPSKLYVVLPMLTMVAATVGGAVGTVVACVIPPLAAVIASGTATVVGANAAVVAAKIYDLKAYNEKKKELENELKYKDQ